MTIQEHIGGEHFLVIRARIGDVVFRDPVIVGGGPLLQRSFGITGFAQLVGALDRRWRRVVGGTPARTGRGSCR